MRKIFTLSLSLALCASLNAETIKLITYGTGVPGIEEPALIGLGISPNGKYICGIDEMAMAYFVADIDTGLVQMDMTADEDEGAELRHVDNNGLAIGYDGPGITYSIDGVRTELPVPNPNDKYILGEDLSNDGSLKVGSIVGEHFFTLAAYSKDNGTWTQLPMPSEEMIGDLGEDGSAAKYVSGDGKVILGYVGNWGPATLWIMNDAGEYECDPIFTEYVTMTEEEMEQGTKPLLGFSPANISDNGKYVVGRGTMINEDGDYQSVALLYDVEARDLKIFDEPQEADSYGFGLNPSAVANDGTIIGIIGQPLVASSGNFIIKAGETQAQTFSEAFPEYDAIFAFPESIGYCVATDMSADGRYILGYGYYSEDFEDYELPAYFQTFVIDRGEIETGVAAVENDSEASPEAFYTIDGKRLNSLSKGLNIVRMSDGSVRKVMK